MTGDNDPSSSASKHLQAGEEALKRGDWAGARAAFEQATALREDAAAFEGLGRAAYWLDDLQATFGASERAYQLYRAAADPIGAARIATQLAMAYVDFQEEFAIGNGWLQRAASLLEGIDPCREHGWLAFYQAMFAVELDNDLAAALVYAERAHALALQIGLFDLQMLTEAGMGYIQVRQGMVREGIQRLAKLPPRPWPVKSRTSPPPAPPAAS
ncbi:MAG: hypothetical protein GEU75_00920 [Dehalococcoidia bacterium]|nr:hypothetical protein [Dehalococcoidia bacterium]